MIDASRGGPLIEEGTGRRSATVHPCLVIRDGKGALLLNQVGPTGSGWFALVPYERDAVKGRGVDGLLDASEEIVDQILVVSAAVGVVARQEVGRKLYVGGDFVQAIGECVELRGRGGSPVERWGIVGWAGW